MALVVTHRVSFGALYYIVGECHLHVFACGSMRGAARVSRAGEKNRNAAEWPWLSFSSVPWKHVATPVPRLIPLPEPLLRGCCSPRESRASKQLRVHRKSTRLPAYATRSLIHHGLG